MRALGFASTDDTAAFASRFQKTTADGHFRSGNGLTVSSIGFGTYLGSPDEATDELYRDASKRAIALGVNVIDTAVNYRYQRSERAIGEALTDAFAAGLSRGSVVVSTKGGFISFDGRPPADAAGWVKENFIKRGVMSSDDIAAQCHCMAPKYLKSQIETSLRNLRLEAIDIYYIHNPETQLPEVDRAEFLRRMRAAFEILEVAVADKKISIYGTATWSGYRHPEDAPDYLSLAQLEGIAREVGGERHHFRAVQLPVNLAMPEAIILKNQTVAGEKLSLLDAAARLGMTVMASGSIYQGQLARDLPPAIGEALPGFQTDAQRALQFARSVPGITTALIGMKTTAHVEENLALAAHPPAAPSQLMKLFA